MERLGAARADLLLYPPRVLEDHPGGAPDEGDLRVETDKVTGAGHVRQLNRHGLSGDQPDDVRQGVKHVTSYHHREILAKGLGYKLQVQSTDFIDCEFVKACAGVDTAA